MTASGVTSAPISKLNKYLLIFSLYSCIQRQLTYQSPMEMRLFFNFKENRQLKGCCKKYFFYKKLNFKPSDGTEACSLIQDGIPRTRA